MSNTSTQTGSQLRRMLYDSGQETSIATQELNSQSIFIKFYFIKNKKSNLSNMNIMEILDPSRIFHLFYEVVSESS